jgi:hypothetical protein
MASHCERPGCTQPAEVLYGMSATTLTVWLDAYDEVLAARVGALCRHHADAMVVPRGWSLDDRREAAPPLFPSEAATKAAATPTPAKTRRRRPRRQASGDDTGQLELVPNADDAAESPAAQRAAEPVVEPVDPTPFSPWRPKFDEDDDLDGLLRARSPLLSRAFRGQSPPGGKKPRSANATDAVGPPTDSMS